LIYKWGSLVSSFDFDFFFFFFFSAGYIYILEAQLFGPVTGGPIYNIISCGHFVWLTAARIFFSTSESGFHQHSQELLGTTYQKSAVTWQ
jgi:hypothetical protein